MTLDFWVGAIAMYLAMFLTTMPNVTSELWSNFGEIAPIILPSLISFIFVFIIYYLYGLIIEGGIAWV